jgi:hypothetical protein
LSFYWFFVDLLHSVCENNRAHSCQNTVVENKR